MNVPPRQETLRLHIGDCVRVAGVQYFAHHIRVFHVNALLFLEREQRLAAAPGTVEAEQELSLAELSFRHYPFAVQRVMPDAEFIAGRLVGMLRHRVGIKAPATRE